MRKQQQNNFTHNKDGHMISKALMKCLIAVSDRRPDDWNTALRDIIKERVKTLPEVQVVDALRAYLDSIWMGPEEQKRLWKEVQIALNTLEYDEIKRNEEHMKKLQLKYGPKT